MPADPQEVFQTDLPAGTSMIVVFVPSQDRDGNPIDPRTTASRITQRTESCLAATKFNPPWEPVAWFP